MNRKPLVFLLGLLVALGTPFALRVVNDAVAGIALVAVYAALGGLCAWLLAGEQRRPIGVGLLVGGVLTAASIAA